MQHLDEWKRWPRRVVAGRIGGSIKDPYVPVPLTPDNCKVAGALRDAHPEAYARDHAK